MMSKKLFAGCLVIAVFTMIPTLATAKPILTDPTGTRLAGEPLVTATNVGNMTIETAVGTVTCTTVKLTGKLKSNETASGLKGEFSSATFAGTGALVGGEPECTGTNFFAANTTVTPAASLPWCLESPVNNDTFALTGGVCGTDAPITFVLDVTGTGECRYTRTLAVTGALVTDGGGAGENTLEFANVAWTREAPSAALCPAEAKLSMRLSLETDDDAHAAIFISS